MWNGARPRRQARLRRPKRPSGADAGCHAASPTALRRCERACGQHTPSRVCGEGSIPCMHRAAMLEQLRSLRRGAPQSAWDGVTGDCQSPRPGTRGTGPAAAGQNPEGHPAARLHPPQRPLPPRVRLPAGRPVTDGRPWQPGRLPVFGPLMRVGPRRACRRAKTWCGCGPDLRRPRRWCRVVAWGGGALRRARPSAGRPPAGSRPAAGRPAEAPRVAWALRLARLVWHRVVRLRRLAAATAPPPPPPKPQPSSSTKAAQL